MNTLYEAQQDERRSVKKVADQIIPMLHNKARLDHVFAEVFDRISCPTLYLEWTVGRFWSLRMPFLLEDVEKIYAGLVSKKHAEKKPFVAGSDTVFYVPDRKKKVLVNTTQSSRFIYIWDKKQTPGFRHLHVRRFFDVWKAEDQWQKEEVTKFQCEVKKDGYKPAVQSAEMLSQYADDYEDTAYPQRYSLEHYKTEKFRLKYGDCRDNGYVLSWTEFKHEVDSPMHTHTSSSSFTSA